jgi:hypothetical protein
MNAFHIVIPRDVLIPLGDVGQSRGGVCIAFSCKRKLGVLNSLIIFSPTFVALLLRCVSYASDAGVKSWP